MNIDDFIKAVSTEKKRIILRAIMSGGEKGIAITAIQAPYIYNNLYIFVKQFVSFGMVEECGLTAPSTTSTFANQAVKYRLTTKGKEIIKILDSIENKK